MMEYREQYCNQSAVEFNVEPFFHMSSKIEFAAYIWEMLMYNEFIYST